MRTAPLLVNTLSLLAFSSALGACSATSTDNSSSALPISSASGSGGNGSGVGGSKGTVALPTQTNGGFEPDAGLGEVKSDCNQKLIGIVRDFNSKDSPVNQHDDFESFLAVGITKGLVMRNLGADGAPAYADPQPPGNPQLSTAANFKRGYSTSHPANATFDLDLDQPPASATLVKKALPDGSTEYASTSFFPVDGKGTQAEDKSWGENKLGDSPVGDQPPFHNYHFTFELNTKFIYKKRQIFSFFGDDDVWVFIDKKLAVDIGGVHPQESGSPDAVVVVDESAPGARVTADWQPLVSN